MKRINIPQEVLNVFGSINDRELIEQELKKGFLHLHFSGETERTFRRYYFHRAIGLIRLSLILGLSIYVVFGMLDFMLYPEFIGKIWLIRYGIGTPVILFTIVYLFNTRSEKGVQLAYSFTVFVVGVSITGMLVIAYSDTAQKYYAGVMLAIFYGYVAAGLRFRPAAITGWAILLSYFVVAVFFIKSDPDFIISNIFFLFFANIVGMISVFIFEKLIRRDFLLSALLNIETHTDGLTQIANLRSFERFFESEWHRAGRHRYPVSLLMIDVDFFKDYNDSCGHRAGDACLVRLASLLKSFQRRPGDMAARYGGEEFVMVLSGTGIQNSVNIAEEIRKKVVGLKIPHPSSAINKYITVSIGVAAMVPSLDDSKEILLEKADQAMYRAKAAGRDRVVADKDSFPLDLLLKG